MKINLLEKPLLTITDIVKLLSCSRTKAMSIRNIIKKRLEAKGKQLVTGDIPTKLFVELMNLDVETLNG